MSRGWAILALALVGALSPGCQSVRYYGQAVQGHCRILFRQSSIEDCLAREAVSPHVKERLRQVLALRRFAESDLSLPAGRHYLRYAELEREFVVWNVFAAPEFSLEAKQWWYPVVGRLSYRGYFQEPMAEACAEELRQEGMDVFVGGVDAYSTLGWFRDPVLDTFLYRDETSLADLLFHELAHQKLFIKGDTDFNEAFATAVAREGVRRWYRDRADQAAAASYELLIAREDAFFHLLIKTRRQLESLYATNADGGVDPVTLRQRKESLLAGLRSEYDILKADWRDGINFDRWFDWPVNNARLNAESTYHEWVPAFENLLADLGGDLAEFFAQVEAIGRLPDAQRQQTLAAWRQRGPGRAWTLHALPPPDLGVAQTE